jgi:hypothetical protein
MFMAARSEPHAESHLFSDPFFRTVMAAPAAGVSMVAVSLGRDQPFTADPTGIRRTPESAGQYTATILANQRFRMAALRLSGLDIFESG